MKIKIQLNQENSHLKVFKDLMELRKSPSFLYGKLSILLANEQVFAFVRKAFGSPVFLVAMNLSSSHASVNLLLNNNIAPRGYVAYYAPGKQMAANNNNSNNSTTAPNDDASMMKPNGNTAEPDFKLKSPVLTKNVALKPFDTLILTWPSSD